MRAPLAALFIASVLAACYLPDGYSGGVASGNSGNGGSSAAGNNGTAGSSGASGTAGTAGKAGAAGAGGSTTTGCMQVAQAHCARLKSQCALSDAARGPAGETHCIARTNFYCEATRALQGTALTEGALVGCAAQLQGLPDLGCEERTSPLTTCALQGTVSGGEACVAASQCNGGACSGANAGCGFCSVQLKEGDSCTGAQQACRAGLSCVGGTCSARLGSGSPCENDAGCLPDFVCTELLCTALPSEVGASCEQMVQCAPSEAIFCNGTTCEKNLQYKANEACLPGVAEMIAQCAVGSWCKPDQAGSGICSPYTTDGGACLQHAECDPPARCFDGKCSFFGACEGAAGQGGSSGGMGGGFGAKNGSAGSTQTP